MYKNNHKTRIFSIIATLLMIFSLVTPALATGSPQENKTQKSSQNNVNLADKISDRLATEFENDEEATFLIKFAEKADTTKVAEEARKAAETNKLSGHRAELSQRSAVISELKSVSIDSQSSVTSFLEEQVENGNVDDYQSYYIVNGMAVTATQDVAEKLANFPEVEKILPNEERQLHTTFDNEAEDDQQIQQDADEVEWNVERVNAPDVWSLGVDGAGTVVASLDTGAQWDHPALKEQYRGYDVETGEVDHENSFYDATSDGHEEPVDDNGHGTHVTGTMIGHEDDGTNQIGVAPGSEWISAKVFDSEGSATDNDLLDAAEWIMAPGGRADLAPDVVNNSWGGGPGLDEWYRDTVKAWRDAEIFPAFAAGNTDLFNPGGPGSVAAPSNYPESFAVGATDMEDVVADFSLRGPSPYDEIKPDISAPGVAIRSAVPDDSYTDNNGTSMASPAVAGVAALLRQVDANLSVDDMEEILLEAATPKTDEEYDETPNNGYGYGLIDAFEAATFISDGLGSIEGSVSEEGEDTEEPTYNHKPVEEVYVDMDSTFKINALDNTSVLSVELAYQANDEEWKTAEASLVSGDYQDGEYEVVVPGDDLSEEGELNYKWTINDFGNNEVTTEEYTALIDEGITTGYFEDFEEEPAGWTSFGEGDDWEWGVPTSGPEEASSGEHVYATNLDGSYQQDANATLVMPAVNLPEGENYLHFDLWYDLEEIHDSGYVYVSTDLEEWKSVRTVFYDSDGWEEREADLSDYSGERVYIGYNITSNTPNEITKPGMYLDNVELASSPRSSSQEKVTQEENEQEETMYTSEVSPNPSVEEEVQPATLPLDASVSVLDGDRSTNTNPADGTYSMSSLAAGEYTVEADAYGYYSETKTVDVESEETTETDFVLDRIPKQTISGVVTDEETGETIENAKLLLVEDANISPVTTNEDGYYDLEAYEGEYTLRIIAEGYNYGEIDLTLDDAQEVNVELDPFHSYQTEEIYYDDGDGDFGRSFGDDGNSAAVKMSLAEGEDSAIVTDGVFRFAGENTPNPGPGSTEFAVEVWDSSGDNGMPGEKIAGPIEAEAIRDMDEWTVIDLRGENIIVEDDFYMVYVQTNVDQYSPALATDATSENAERSYEYTDGFWKQASSLEGNFMIRSRVGYEVDEAVIIDPESGTLTNEETITITGEATPGAEVQLNNNDEAAGSTEAEEDGTFTFETTLSEGDNELTVATLLDGSAVGESEVVSVTLDTTAPELTIDNPTDGEKTNRETVTVEGTVSDENLDYVEINGQEVEVDDQDYAKRILLVNGENVVEVTAVDLVGNVTTESVTLDVKYDAPEISNVTPDQDVDLETGESVKIEFDSEPGLQATFVVHMPLTDLGSGVVSASNPTELPMMEMADGKYVGYWTVPANVRADGARIEVRTRDSYQNETKATAEGKLFINLEE